MNKTLINMIISRYKYFEFKKYHLYIFFFLFLIITTDGISQQIDSLKLFEMKQRDKQIIDSVTTQRRIDSINNQTSIINEKVKKSGLDTIVNYQSKDSIRFNIKSQSMRLRGEAQVNFKKQKLAAEIIELDFKSSLLYAKSTKDTNNKLYGFPKFNDSGEQFVGQEIKYNFKTNQGTISLGETEMGEGFYFGERIKRISQTELFVENGFYTTCNHPEPHYHFGSPKMKIIAQDRIFLDPLIMYVEDIPVFILPFGLFFPSKGGKQSGLMVPTFSFSNSRGVVFQNLGFYWAISDYMDAQFTTDLYTKGGFMLKNTTRYKLLNQYDGNFNIEWGQTRNNVDEDYATNFKFGLRHNQSLTPDEKITANLDFRSSNFNRNTQTNQMDYQTQSVRSAASYSKSFDNRSTLSISYDRNQNIINDTYDQSLPLSYSFPSTKIFNSFTDAPKWIRDIQFNYRFSASYSDNTSLSFKSHTIKDTITNKDSLYIDTLTNFRSKYRIEHSPSISISPKLGFFTVTPSISFGANNYIRKINKVFNPIDSTISVDTINGFYADYRASFGLGLSTTIYGDIDDKRPILFLIKPSSLGIKAFRHIYKPNFSFSYTPDQSSENLGFYGYYNDEQNRSIQYSRFELDGGGIASSRLSSRISYSDLNSLMIKVKESDTSDIALEILNFSLGTGYDFAKDSFQLDDIRLTMRSPALKLFDMNMNATFTPYDEIVTYKTNSNGEKEAVYQKINSYIAENKSAWVRMTSFNLSISTRFSSDGSVLNPSATSLTGTNNDSIGIGERFSKRINYSEQEDDIYGCLNPGWTEINMPWSIGLDLTYAYSQYSINPSSKNETLSLRMNANVQITETWRLSASGNYDFINNEIGVPQLNFTKDMHCWDFTFNWIPTGGNAGFYLRFGIKASQLQDLKIEKQDNPLLR